MKIHGSLAGWFFFFRCWQWLNKFEKKKKKKRKWKSKDNNNASGVLGVIN